MNTDTIITLVRDLTDTDSDTFSDSAIMRHVNVSYGHRILNIIRLQVDKNASVESATTDLIAAAGLNDGDVGKNGEYPCPTELIRPVRLEASLEGKLIAQ